MIKAGECGQAEISKECQMHFRWCLPLMVHPTLCDLPFCELFPDSLSGISAARRSILVALESSYSSIVDRIKLCGSGGEEGNDWDVQVQCHLIQGSLGSQQCSCQAKLCLCLLWWLPAVWLPGLPSPGC